MLVMFATETDVHSMESSQLQIYKVSNRTLPCLAPFTLFILARIRPPTSAPSKMTVTTTPVTDKAAMRELTPLRSGEPKEQQIVK